MFRVCNVRNPVLHNGFFLDRSEITWCVEDEQRLRRHISRLKGERAMVRSTAVELESVHAEPLNSKNTISLAEARKLDLETAVLMQVGYPLTVDTEYQLHLCYNFAPSIM